MGTVEFQTNIKNGVIEIPEPYKANFTPQDTVRVIVITQPQTHTQSTNLLQHLLDHPLKIDSFVPLQREDIYER